MREAATLCDQRLQLEHVSWYMRLIVRLCQSHRAAAYFDDVRLLADLLPCLLQALRDAVTQRAKAFPFRAGSHGKRKVVRVRVASGHANAAAGVLDSISVHTSEKDRKVMCHFRATTLHRQHNSHGS